MRPPSFFYNKYHNNSFQMHHLKRLTKKKAKKNRNMKDLFINSIVIGQHCNRPWGI